MRVLITGMGGELGTRVANLVEADPRFTDIHGIDAFPPRRRITRTSFHRIDPRDRRKIVQLVRDIDPELILHLGVYEPHARVASTPARLFTAASAVSTLGAASSGASLRHIVVRSGIEVYGRRRGGPTRPDESAEPVPTTPWGRSLAHVEEVAAEAGQVASVPVTSLRMAPVVGPSVPSPLGRYLRLPAVAVNPVVELPFQLLHQEDAAAAVLAATRNQHDGPLNVVGSGAVTASQAAVRGRRFPVPTAGWGWRAAAIASELLGAPRPPHTRELLVRGAVADGARALELLGIDPRPTDDVITQLYRWETVAHPEVARSPGIARRAGT